MDLDPTILSRLSGARLYYLIATSPFYLNKDVSPISVFIQYSYPINILHAFAKKIHHVILLLLGFDGLNDPYEFLTDELAAAQAAAVEMANSGEDLSSHLSGMTDDGTSEHEEEEEEDHDDELILLLELEEEINTDDNTVVQQANDE